MKPATTAFRDQICTVANWFSTWSSCEQTIALHSLLCQISAGQARFLSLVLEQRSKHDSSQTDELEQEANNPDFIARLCTEPRSVAVSSLLAYLPLLHPGNSNARQQYIVLFKVLLQDATDRGSLLDQCRQLLSLAFVHPAFPASDRAALRWCLNNMDKPGAAGESSRVPRHAPSSSPSPSTSAAVVDDPRADGRIQCESPVLWRLSNQKGVQYGYSATQSFGCSTDDKYNRAVGRTRSLQDHAVVDPHHNLSMMVRSNSLPPLQTNSPFPERTLSKKRSNYFAGQGSGMKGVPSWLKSLRLHKYQDLFAEMTYDEMLSLTDVKLQEKGVTRGARHKILSSIQKLHYRPEVLARLEMDLDSPGKLLPAIHKVHHMLCTPIKPYSLSELTSLGDSGIVCDMHSCSLDNLSHTGLGQDAYTAEEVNSRSASPYHTNLSVLGSALCEQSSMVGSSQDLYATEEVCSRTSSPSLYCTSSSGASPRCEHPGVDSIDTSDIPGLITAVITKACTQLANSGADEETFTSCLALVEKAICHEAFTAEQKKRFFFLKCHCQKASRQAQQAWQDSVQLWHAVPASSPLNPTSFSQQTPVTCPQLSTSVTRSLPTSPLNTDKPLQLVRQDAGPFPGSASNPFGAPGAKQGTHQPALGELHSKSKQRASKSEGNTGCQSSDADKYMMNLCLSMTEHALAAP